MITMPIRRVDCSSTPIISDNEIDMFAHDVLADYKPSLLQEPGAIKFEHFLESYLGVTILYKDIYHRESEPPIFGATAFADGSLKVFDRENQRVGCIDVPANTVIIDNYVMKPGKEGLATFTGLHEGGHILIHPGVFAPDDDGQISLLGEELSQMVCCHRESVEGFGRKHTGRRTPKEWLEHHADYFAAALAMPLTTFKPFVHQILREHNIWKGCIVTGNDGDLDLLAREILPEYISEVYGVSKQAAFIKLKKTGFVQDRQTYRATNAQFSLQI